MYVNEIRFYKISRIFKIVLREYKNDSGNECQIMFSKSLSLSTVIKFFASFRRSIN